MYNVDDSTGLPGGCEPGQNDEPAAVSGKSENERIMNKPSTLWDQMTAEKVRLQQENELFRRMLGLSPGSLCASTKATISTAELEEAHQRIATLEARAVEVDMYEVLCLLQSQKLLEVESRRNRLFYRLKEIHEKVLELLEKATQPEVIELFAPVAQKFENVLKIVENQEMTAFNISSGDEEDSVEQNGYLEKARSKLYELTREIYEKEKWISEVENELSQSSHCNDHRSLIAIRMNMLSEGAEMDEQKGQAACEAEEQIPGLDKMLDAVRNFERAKAETENYLKNLRAEIDLLKQEQAKLILQQQKETANDREAKAITGQENNVP